MFASFWVSGGAEYGLAAMNFGITFAASGHIGAKYH
jgi:hypothetical protein